MMGTNSSAAPTSWLGALDRASLGRLVSRRMLDLAVASALRYAEAPVVAHGWVRALLVHEDGGDEAFETALTMVNGPGLLEGDCSRCAQSFGPCLHVSVLAVDLACSRELREALAEGRAAAHLSARAREVRLAFDTERRFDGALAAWLAPTVDGDLVEIAAAPRDESAGAIGRPYGDRGIGQPPTVSLFVRVAGERKLLAPREVREHRRLRAAERRVLEHAHDRGSARKCLAASGVEASVTIEAMRAHGGIFALGYKQRLDFRSHPARPTVSLAAAVGRAIPFDTLTLMWTPDGGEPAFAASDAVFFPGPYPFVWARSGAIHRVAADVDLELAAELTRSPTLRVPPGRLREAGARLLRAARGRGIALPAHERFGLPALERPNIVLQLQGQPLDVTGELVAHYRARSVPLIPDAGLLPEEGRDIETEARAVRVIEDARLVAGREPATGDATAGTAPAGIVLRDEDAIAFWHAGLPALRSAAGGLIEIRLSEQLARVRIGAALRARVRAAVLEGNWLSARLEFASQDLPVELDAIRAALARKTRWVALSDGTLARITSSVETLSDEAQTIMKGSEATLPAHQLGRLDRWLRDNDGTMDASVDALRARLRALAVVAEPELPSHLRGTLRPYQKLGLAWLQFLQALGAGGILADDMGLGKTITTLAFLLRRKEAEGSAPSLVVCPTSVATNWVREAARFTPDLRVLLLHGPSRHRAASEIDQADVLVTTYALLRRDIDFLAAVRFRVAVLDEAQNIKNAESATARAACGLDASMRLALSGTPIENRLSELWSLASFTNPGMLGTARAFEARFERPMASDPSSPVSEELRALVRPFLLRRTKDEVLRELPPKTEVDRVAILRPWEKRLYDALAHTLRVSVAQNIERRRGLSGLDVFTALTRLRQMACDPRLVDARLGRQGPMTAKREAFLDVVRELAAEGRRALVFSQFVELLSLWRQDLEAGGIAYEYLDGATRRRDEVVARFQDGKAPLFLISLKAGGAGLNLTAADTVVLCDPWWNPAVEDQAADRAHRIGQDKPVTVVRLVAQGTIEEKIVSLKAKKRLLTRAVIGDGEGALSGLSDDDVRHLLGDLDADPAGASDDEGDGDAKTAPSPTDVIATHDRVVDPEYDALAVQVQWWLASTGRTEAEFAAYVDLPGAFAHRLARGLPFPCSRAVVDRIRSRLRAW